VNDVLFSWSSEWVEQLQELCVTFMLLCRVVVSVVSVVQNDWVVAQEQKAKAGHIPDAGIEPATS
jgi:hypothetical protein